MRCVPSSFSLSLARARARTLSLSHFMCACDMQGRLGQQNAGYIPTAPKLAPGMKVRPSRLARVLSVARSLCLSLALSHCL